MEIKFKERWKVYIVYADYDKEPREIWKLL